MQHQIIKSTIFFQVLLYSCQSHSIVTIDSCGRALSARFIGVENASHKNTNRRLLFVGFRKLNPTYDLIRSILIK